MKKRTVSRKKDGFALIITILLLSMLTVLAIGMLSLGAITLRGGSVAENKRTANSNAQLALMLAIGELQKNLGSDQRITADAALLKPNGDPKDVTPQPQDKMVGVWESYNPYSDTTVPAPAAAPNYQLDKRVFKKWLISTPDTSATQDSGYGLKAAPEGAPVLFSKELDGFQMNAEEVPVATADKTTTGAYAWAVSQENTKAKINVGGDSDRFTGNDSIQAPSRPNLNITDKANKNQGQPDGGWVVRNGKVITLSQAALDTGYGVGKEATRDLGPDYTATAQGVLADVVKGRLKTDLSLAFEMADTDFKKSNWDGITNPFALGANAQKETPLFSPMASTNSGGPISFEINYGAVDYRETFYVGSPPTFETLRSYYQLYRHIYNSGGPTAYQRPQRSTYWPGSNYAPLVNAGTQTAVGPVLDRMFMVYSMYVTSAGMPAVVLSPVITLWNPYNVAIEGDGYVAYPFIDLPNGITFHKGGKDYGKNLSQYAGLEQYKDEGRMQWPYLYCQMTSGGTDNTSTPIHLEPGEVKIFAPVDSVPQVFSRADSKDTKKDINRVVHMKPVTDVVSVKGGVAYPYSESYIPVPSDADKKAITCTPSDSLSVTIDFQIKGQPDGGHNYRYGVALEDSARIAKKYVNRIEPTAKIINEIHVYPNNVKQTTIISSGYPVSRLMKVPQIVGALDTYHRTATPPDSTTKPNADMVFSINPRQRYSHPNLGPTTKFSNGTGPHYETHMVSGVEIAGMQFSTSINPAGDSYYGETNSPARGKSHLSFFEIPREPMMSLGNFQHADLTDLVSAPAFQFGNSWASPYVGKTLVQDRYRSPNSDASVKYFAPVTAFPVYDTSYLVNSALWDGYYFSSIAPRGISPGSSVGSPTEAGLYAPGSKQSTAKEDTSKVIAAWLKDPQVNPLRNPRYVLHQGSMSTDELQSALLAAKGCRDVSGHLMVDGAFNVNSTSLRAWESVLSSMKGEQFTYVSSLSSGTYKNASNTAFPRMRYPADKAVEDGSANDNLRWTGFRTLTDSQISALAANIVKEVKKRGPFQSMSEFVNRQIGGGSGTGNPSDRGAIQAAIDGTSINNVARLGPYQTTSWDKLSGNITDPDVGTGIPGWLTQADVLTGLAPFITVRSDTFTVRAYGEARDSDDNITARSWCEATVQRMPEFVDTKNEPGVDLAALTTLNTQFGRRFEITAFRWISPDEITPSAAV